MGLGLFFHDKKRHLLRLRVLPWSNGMLYRREKFHSEGRQHLVDLVSNVLHFAVVDELDARQFY
jgi:hypothetical protein